MVGGVVGVVVVGLWVTVTRGVGDLVKGELGAPVVLFVGAHVGTSVIVT